MSISYYLLTSELIISQWLSYYYLIINWFRCINKLIFSKDLVKLSSNYFKPIAVLFVGRMEYTCPVLLLRANASCLDDVIGTQLKPIVERDRHNNTYHKQAMQLCKHIHLETEAGRWWDATIGSCSRTGWTPMRSPITPRPPPLVHSAFNPFKMAQRQS